MVDYLYRLGDWMRGVGKVRFRLVNVYENIYALLLYNDWHQIKLQNKTTKQKTWVFWLISRGRFNIPKEVMILCSPATVYIRYFVVIVQFQCTLLKWRCYAAQISGLGRFICKFVWRSVHQSVSVPLFLLTLCQWMETRQNEESIFLLSSKSS